MIKHARLLVSAIATLLSPLTHAEVVESSTAAFKIKHKVEISAAPEKVYKTLVDIGSWWDSAHTYSNNSANLRLETKSGGCWCETLPNGGGVQHMTVVYIEPNKRITLSGALGPLQTNGLAGAMTWQLVPKDNGTEFVLVYNVGGYATGGLVDLANGVDGVLRDQVERLKRVVETGSPVEPKTTDNTRPHK